jgi:endo-1,4-beta-xylanase
MKNLIVILFWLVLEFGFNDVYGNSLNMRNHFPPNIGNISDMTIGGDNMVSLFDSEEDTNYVRSVESEILAKASENIEKYRKGNASIVFLNASGKAIRNAEIEIIQQSHAFLFGSTAFDLVRGDLDRMELYKQRFKEIFNFAQLPVYWRSYEPTPGMTRWESMLPAISWCRENDIVIKGHPLTWTNPSGVPDWLSDFPVTVGEELLKARIINVVKGYQGKIDMWDVVNEPVHTRTWNHVDISYGTKESVQDAADYCEKAFKWAYMANPEGNLILNEFQQIMSLTVRQRFYDLVAELKRRNTPITGLGIQAHEPWDCWFPPQEVWATFDHYADLGYPLHITEYMPQSGGKEITGGWREGTWTEENQAEFAEQFFRLCFGHPAVTSITWMGLSDRRIYLPGGGIVDENYRPKLVYKRLSKLIHEEWKTKLSTETNKEGMVKFNGFYGKYKVTLTTNDITETFDIHLRENEENKWIFKVRNLNP